MFGKIYKQIFDSSIAEDWQVRCVFQDMVVLADEDGIVDMTPQALARKTNVPIDIIRRAITELEKPDPESRSAVDDGARIKRLDGHRTWGWFVVNYHKYRLIATEIERRNLNRERMADYRNRVQSRKAVAGRSTTTAHTAYTSTSTSASVPEGVQGEPTFEQAMERVPIQLRERVSKDFAKLVFDSWNGRDGKDGGGVNVRFEKLLQKRWTSEGEQWRNGCHSAQKQSRNNETPTNCI